jgi:hypothetical protein
MLVHKESLVDGASLPPCNSSRQGGYLTKLLHSNTTIAIFECASAADNIMATTIDLKEVKGVWLWRSINVATKLREEWRSRPFATRLTGTRMQERIIEQVVSELQKGHNVVVIHARSSFDWRSTYSGANHLIHLGTWTFDFVR